MHLDRFNLFDYNSFEQPDTDVERSILINTEPWLDIVVKARNTDSNRLEPKIVEYLLAGESALTTVVLGRTEFIL